LRERGTSIYSPPKKNENQVLRTVRGGVISETYRSHRRPSPERLRNVSMVTGVSQGIGEGMAGGVLTGRFAVLRDLARSTSSVT